jgi:2-iminobutanoate/2-iminopropanoate deaminase
MSHHAVVPADAPAPVGPYSPAVVDENNGIVYVSGQVPLNPKTGKLAPGDIIAQTRQALENVRSVLSSAGSGMDRVLKTTVFMTDLKEFPQMNEVYATFFTGVKPARATIQVGGLPLGARVEIEAIASL